MENKLKDFMIKDLINGVPSFEIEEFAEKAGYNLDEFKKLSREVDISKMWDHSIEQAQMQLKIELSNIKTRSSQIDKEFKSTKMKLPFLNNKKKKQLLTEKQTLDLNEIETKCSIINSHNYYCDFKKQIDMFHSQLSAQQN